MGKIYIASNMISQVLFASLFITSIKALFLS